MSSESSNRQTKHLPRREERRLSDLGPPEGIEQRFATADRRHENNRQYATFFLEDHFLGVEVEKVQEILNPQEMTKVPLAPAMIAGLINLRGEIVTAIDLRICLGFSTRPPDVQAMSLVVRTEDGPVNLLVDKIGDVIEVLPNLFEPPPETLDKQFGSAIEGVYKLKERLMLVLNIEAGTHVQESIG